MESNPVINCSFLDKASLYLAYMPFVVGGGLFIRTQQTYLFEEKVELIVSLMNEQNPYVVQGKVIWMTPQSVEVNKPTGIGIQLLSQDSWLLTNKIETYLADMLNSSQSTDTF